MIEFGFTIQRKIDFVLLESVFLLHLNDHEFSLALGDSIFEKSTIRLYIMRKNTQYIA